MILSNGSYPTLANVYKHAGSSFGQAQLVRQAGLGAGYPEIENLQRELLAYSQATGVTAANPGAITGVVNVQTVMALGAVLRELPIPKFLKDSLQFVIPAYAFQTDVQAQVDLLLINNSHTIVQGIKAALIAKQTGGSIPAPSTGPFVPADRIPDRVGPFRVERKGEAATAPSPTPTTGKFAAFDPKIGAYRIAMKKGAVGTLGLELEGVSLSGPCTEVGTSPTPPEGVTIIPLTEFKSICDPWYKRPLILGGIGAGVLALGVAVWYFFIR